MSYKALYLPTSDQIWVDGCSCIDEDGAMYEYDASNYTHSTYQSNYRVAELMIVDMRFNQMVVIGRPSPGAKWLTNGTDVKRSDIAATRTKCSMDDVYMLNIHCPVCHELH